MTFTATPASHRTPPAHLRPRTPRSDRPRLRAALTALAALATGLTLTLGAAPAQAAPPSPSGLPSTVEPLSPYVPDTSCDGGTRPGTRALGDLLARTYATTYITGRACGTSNLARTEHYDGRAVDVFFSTRVASQRAKAADLVTWLFKTDARGNRYANARRLGVMYVIWDGKIWGSYNTAAGWRPYSSCATTTSAPYDTTCHRDHVHISLSWAGAMGRTSWWSKRVAPTEYGPCRVPDLAWAPSVFTVNTRGCTAYGTVPARRGASAVATRLNGYSGMLVQRGSTGPLVTDLQRVLLVTPTGYFGTVTEGRLRAYQARKRIPQTGRLDPTTWRALLVSVGAR